MNKKVCVLGGSGFLGSHVADGLTRAGYQVVIYDCNKSIWLNGNQKFVQGDLLDEDLLNKTIKDCVAVYNFAAIADLDAAQDKAIDTIRINILGNVNALEACRKNGVGHFLYASSAYVLSREGGFYRCSKQAAESYVEEFNKRYGLKFTILRYGSLYGPRSDVTNGLFRIVKNALDTQLITYQGSKESFREYVHVEDAASASVEALTDPLFENQSIMLTGQEPMRVLDMLKMLSEILNIKSEVEFIDYHKAGHYIRTPYAYETKIGKKYIPSMHVDLGQGLLQMVNYINSIKECTE